MNENLDKPQIINNELIFQLSSFLFQFPLKHSSLVGKSRSSH